MCGICGILGSSYNKGFPLAALTHRGPDSEGKWTDHANRVWLGHTRLSILDLEDTGRQPMRCVEGRYQIVFDGEIFNFIELRKELESKGYKFCSNSDTEIIPAAYDYWGPNCLHHFNGMWAFAIWDTQKKELWLARDRFGEKPLYYCRRGDDFAFASEVQVLHRWLGFEVKLDSEVIHSICNGKFEWHGTNRTYLTDVSILPAGYSLRRLKDHFKLEQWYRLEPNRVVTPARLTDQAMALRDLLEDACRLRLRSDVAVATCLSGGLDSSSVVGLVHRGLRQDGERIAKDFHRLFCASFPNTMLDETDAARKIATTVGANLKICEINPPTAGRLLKAISSCDGPMHSLAFYPIWELYRLIREDGVKVSLDGQGADEMMGGYCETIQSALKSALRKGNLSWFWDIYKAYSEQGEHQYRSSKVIAKSELLRLLKTPLSRLKRILLNRLVDSSVSSREYLKFAHPIPLGLGSLREELYSQFCQKHLPTFLQQFDSCSMAHGVECRMPFMDYRIVEFVFSLPEESLVSGGYTKRVLREAVNGIVPESTRLNKVKIGFNAPIVEWFLGPLREVILDTMRSSIFLGNQFFDGPRLAKGFEAWLNLPNWDGAWGFWPPVHFVLWQNQVKTRLSDLSETSLGDSNAFSLGVSTD